MNNFFLFLSVILMISILGCSSATILPDGQEAKFNHLHEGEQADEKVVHIHSDFKVYINGKAIDFSLPKYQLRDKSVHIEGGIGDLIHVHKENITTGIFFKTLDIRFSKTCIVIPAEGSYCSLGNKKLSFYVNGIENNEFEDYEIIDMDKILVSYGEGDIENQLETITNLAAE